MGYRMAGFNVVWANEFIRAARDTYELNHPECTIDPRDIRDIKPEEIRERVGEIDLLDGSPPCSAFSTAGKRQHGWGQVKDYSDTQQRVDDLFFEFARILKGLQPRVFVAENVAGLVKGAAKGMFLEILSTLKQCGYRVTCRVLDAQWLGVPQSRRRTIFVGTRLDLDWEPVHPKPLPYRYTVIDALPWIVSVEDGLNRPPKRSAVPCPTILTHGNRKTQSSREVEADTRMYPCYESEWDKLLPGQASEKFFSLVRIDPSKPCPTVDTSAERASVCHPYQKRKFSIAELRRICGFPDDFQLTGTYAQQWERLGRAVPPVMMHKIADAIAKEIFKV